MHTCAYIRQKWAAFTTSMFSLFRSIFFILTGQVGKKYGERGKATVEKVQQWVEKAQICMQKCHVWLHPPRYLKRQTLVSSEGRSLCSGPLRIILLVTGGKCLTYIKKLAAKDENQLKQQETERGPVKDLRGENFKIVCLLLKGIKCLLFRIATFEKRGGGFQNQHARSLEVILSIFRWTKWKSTAYLRSK